jgi:5-methylcytosine-specific restriction endonuclease McrA
MAEVKGCSACREIRPLHAFNVSNRAADGRQGKCKRCANAYAAKYRAANLAKERERQAEYQSRSRADATRRARKAGVAHEPYSRSEIFARYDGACAYCDAPAQHLDHVHPISKGGADAPHNLVPACAPCNLSKGAKTLAEWSLTFGA